MEVVAKVTTNLELGTNISYQNSRLESFVPGVNAAVGDRLPGSAKFTIYSYGQYTVDLNDGARAFIRGDYSYRSKQFSELNNATSLVFGNYSQVNAQLGVKLSNIDFILFVENLADEHGRANAVRLLRSPMQVTQAPRTVGLTFRARY